MQSKNQWIYNGVAMIDNLTILSYFFIGRVFSFACACLCNITIDYLGLNFIFFQSQLTIIPFKAGFSKLGNFKKLPNSLRRLSRLNFNCLLLVGNRPLNFEHLITWSEGQLRTATKYGPFCVKQMSQDKT